MQFSNKALGTPRGRVPLAPLPVRPATGRCHGHRSFRLLVQTGKRGGTLPSKHPRFVACLQRPTARSTGDLVLMQWPWFIAKFPFQWERVGSRSEVPGKVQGLAHSLGPAGSQRPGVPVFWKHSYPFCSWPGHLGSVTGFCGGLCFFDVTSLLLTPELPRLSKTRQLKGTRPLLCDVKIL